MRLKAQKGYDFILLPWKKRLKLPAMRDLNLSDIKQMALNDQENSIGLSSSMRSLCTLSYVNFAQLQEAAFFLHLSLYF